MLCSGWAVLCRPAGLWEPIRIFDHHPLPEVTAGAAERCVRRADHGLCPAVIHPAGEAGQQHHLHDGVAEHHAQHWRGVCLHPGLVNLAGSTATVLGGSGGRMTVAEVFFLFLRTAVSVSPPKYSPSPPNKYLCVHVAVYVSVCLHVSAWTCVCLCVCVCQCVHMCAHACMHCVCQHVCVYVHMWGCVIFVGVIIKLSGLPACVEDGHYTNPFFVCLLLLWE